jgi:O-antigen ligase
MTVVQIGQVSIYLLSFVVLWLTPNVIGDLKWLRRLAYTFLGVIAAALVVLLALRPRGVVLPHLSGIWMVALALGLAACDSGLSARQRGLLLVVGLAGPIGLRLFHQGWMANWVPPIVAAAAVLWFYSPRVRWPLVVSLVLLLGLVGTAGLLRAVNWDYEWETSGGSRLALWRSVIELASGSPWLGLGPGAYRHYHYTKPLAYGGALWMRPTVSAHNLFVDLFAQVGLLGLACYVWLLVEIFLMAWRLYTRRDGFARGYALGALGALAGLLVADMLAASSLPFVYNVGFKGFRGSALSWMLFGGLVVLETLSGPETRES